MVLLSQWVEAAAFTIAAAVALATSFVSGGLLQIGSGGCGLLLLSPLRTASHAHNASTVLYLWRAEYQG